MQEDKRLDWIATFELWDRQKRGCLPLSDIILLVKCMGCNPTIKEINKIYDQHGKSLINLEQFLTIMSRIDNEEQLKSDVLDAFRCLDYDENGFIPQVALKKKLTSLGRRPFSDKEYESLIQDTPPTNHGEIDLILLSRTIMAKAIK